ncbi:MAG: imidazoleglycerol-phosphate dehydratase HisB [Candidatus Aminicenantes bacterium]|nr:imidazoleglycerol-phosphate dehydratase HisB [Candidatus Aminicenantes bacterium]
MKRSAELERNTKETRIRAKIDLDGRGHYNIKSPLGFFNHMLESFSRHGNFDLDFYAEGDLHVDQHHLIEDSGSVLGRIIHTALGNRKGINRTGFFVFPMDDALAVVAVDLGGRPYLQYSVEFKRRFLGDFDTDLLEDFFCGFSVHLQANLAVRMPYGRSDHHKMEAIFKALGKAMRMAVSLNPLEKSIPSTKGIINNDWNN